MSICAWKSASRDLVLAPSRPESAGNHTRVDGGRISTVISAPFRRGTVQKSRNDVQSEVDVSWSSFVEGRRPTWCRGGAGGAESILVLVAPSHETRRDPPPLGARPRTSPSGNVVRASPRTSTYASSDEGDTLFVGNHRRNAHWIMSCYTHSMRLVLLLGVLGVGLSSTLFGQPVFGESENLSGGEVCNFDIYLP